MEAGGLFLSSALFVWTFISLRYTLMQASCCLHANEVSNIASWCEWEKLLKPASVIHTTSQMWLRSHVSESNSASAALSPFPSFFFFYSRKWLHRLQKSMTVRALAAAPTLLEKVSKWVYKSSGGGAEKRLWRSVYLCRMVSPNCEGGSDRKRLAARKTWTRGHPAWLSSLSWPVKVSAREGTWERCSR